MGIFGGNGLQDNLAPTGFGQNAARASQMNPSLQNAIRQRARVQPQNQMNAYQRGPESPQEAMQTPQGPTQAPPQPPTGPQAPIPQTSAPPVSFQTSGGPQGPTPASSGQLAPPSASLPSLPPGAIAAPPVARDTSQWNTDGYAKPEWLPDNYGKNPVLAGANAEKWQNPNHVTPKYVVRQIQSNHLGDDGLLDRTEMAAAAADIARAYPGSTYNGKDQITIPGVGTMDVVGGISDDGKGVPRWGSLKDANGNPVAQRQPTVFNQQPGSVGALVADPNMNMDIGSASSQLASLLQALQLKQGAAK